MRRIALFGLAVLAAAAAGCGGGDRAVITGPGFVGIDDTGAGTAPLLTVTFTVPPSPIRFTARILSDPASDGHIIFDPVLNAILAPVAGPPTVFFGEESSHPDFREFRGFLTFPLDGTTGQDAVPGDASIVSATLELFVESVSFAPVVPTFLDLVQYPFRRLSQADFNDVPLDFRTLDFLSSDPGNFVLIDVTPLMVTAQSRALLDFQVRLSVDFGGTLAASRAPGARAAERSVRAEPRAADDALRLRRRPGSATQAGPTGALRSR